MMIQIIGSMILKYETIMEIERVYPNSIENQMAYKICDKQFRLKFGFHPEDVIQQRFKSYKIDCWYQADVKMKDKKFFG